MFNWRDARERISGMLTKIYWDAEKGKEGDPADPGTDPNKGKENLPEETFETFLEKQDPKVKELYEKHTSGLRSALSTEREEKKTLSAQLKELLPKAEKGSELESKLTETVGKMEAAERRAAFAEEAIKPEIGCRNIKAAFALATADNLFDSRGNPDWEKLKQIAPELFGKPGSTDGGAGGNNTPTSSMNDLIRGLAGRK